MDVDKIRKLLLRASATITMLRSVAPDGASIKAVALDVQDELLESALDLYLDDARPETEGAN